MATNKTTSGYAKKMNQMANDYKNVQELLASNFSFTDKEVEMIKTLNDTNKSYFGEMYSDHDCNDLAKLLGWDVKTVKGVVGSLVKKNVFTTWDTGTGFEVISFVRQEEMSYHHFKVEDFKPAADIKGMDKTTSTRKVGDIHKNGIWAWTEYKPGKFDWRGIKGAAKPAKTGTIIETTLGEKTADGKMKINVVAEPEQLKLPTKKEMLQNMGRDLTPEECEAWFQNYGKESDIFVSNRWEYFQGKIGSCTMTIVNSKTDKSKSFDKHPDWRPLAYYCYSTQGWNGKSIEIKGFCQSWEEIRNAASDTENMTFRVQKHPKQ